MIIIEAEKDLDLLRNGKNRDILVVRYLTQYFYALLREYDCTSLREHGGLILLEDCSDLTRHWEWGLSVPLHKSAPEFCEKVNIVGINSISAVIHACFVLSNSYALSLFAQEDALDYPTLNHLLGDCTSRTVHIKN